MITEPCPECAETEYRPSGTQTYTVNGRVHKTAECADWDAEHGWPLSPAHQEGREEGDGVDSPGGNPT